MAPPTELPVSVGEYEKSPYSRCGTPETTTSESSCDIPIHTLDLRPGSPAAMTDAEQGIFYLHEAPQPEIFLTQLSDSFKKSFPSETFSVEWKYSCFSIDWTSELNTLEPLLSRAKLVHAYRLHVTFQGEGPGIDGVEDLETFIRNKCREEHGMPDIVVEITMLHEGRTLSSWYPPTPDLNQLKELFEGGSSHGSTSQVEKIDMEPWCISGFDHNAHSIRWAPWREPRVGGFDIGGVRNKPF